MLSVIRFHRDAVSFCVVVVVLNIAAKKKNKNKPPGWKMLTDPVKTVNHQEFTPGVTS